MAERKHLPKKEHSLPNPSSTAHFAVSAMLSRKVVKRLDVIKFDNVEDMPATAQQDDTPPPPNKSCGTYSVVGWQKSLSQQGQPPRQ